MASSDEVRRVLFRDMRFEWPEDALTGEGKKAAEAGARTTWRDVSTSKVVLEVVEAQDLQRQGKRGVEEPTSSNRRRLA